jgi:thymidylate kinase
MIATEAQLKVKPGLSDDEARQVMSSVADAKGALLARVFDVLDRDGLAYCVLHGYDTFPHRVPGDVDLLIPREMIPRRLAELLRANESKLGARVVQWFNDRAHLVVLCAPAAAPGEPPVMLQLHVSTDYDVRNRVIYAGDEIIRTRRRSEGGDFWIPAKHVEFICVLANRVEKKKLTDAHAKRLSGFWSDEREKCTEELFKWFTQDSTRRIADAAESGDWSRVTGVLPALRREMLRIAALRQPGSFALRAAAQQARRARRWASPDCGMHVVFLGPDGVGKSTVIERVQQNVADAFLHMNYQTFARSLLPNKPKESPHALPPRGFAASLLKAAWWANCYTLGYLKSVHPTRARGGVVINHRYLLDAIVDPKRYRYAGPMQLLKYIWAVAPKPDLVVILDAPPEVIHRRKQEVPFEEIARQREAYRTLAGSIPFARIVDTSQSLDKTVDDVTALILGETGGRVARRYRTR